jgi:hypothetical protein
MVKRLKIFPTRFLTILHSGFILRASSRVEDTDVGSNRRRELSSEIEGINLLTDKSIRNQQGGDYVVDD